MNIDLSRFVNKGETVAVACSGGGDSMALLHYLRSECEKYKITVVALNVEHGIRGDESKKDSLFVKDYCEKEGIPLLFYEIDSIQYAKTQKLSLEEGARELRYRCFSDAIKKGACDKIATAHHLSDQFESVLMNLFRGTALKGLTGIEEKRQSIIRPFLSIEKSEIEEYLAKNNIPFVTDATNFDQSYTRNYVRLSVTPIIEKVFPEAKKSLLRTVRALRADEEFLSKLAEEKIHFERGVAKISLPCEKSLFSRASVKAMKYLGVKKDWTSAHIESTYALALLENGARINLPGDVIAIKEYDAVVFYKNFNKNLEEFSFSDGKFFWFDKVYDIISLTQVEDLKDGINFDADKVPKDAVVRTRREGDVFQKFGGGTKSLGDFFTDKKIPLRLRDNIPLLASGKDILVIFGVAVSDKVRVDENTRNIKKIISERN